MLPGLPCSALPLHALQTKYQKRGWPGNKASLLCLIGCMDLLLLQVMCREPVVDAASSSNQPLSKITEESAEESRSNGVLVEVQPHHSIEDHC